MLNTCRLLPFCREKSLVMDPNQNENKLLALEKALRDGVNVEIVDAHRLIIGDKVSRNGVIHSAGQIVHNERIGCGLGPSQKGETKNSQGDLGPAF